MPRLFTVSLPIADRQRSYAFYQETLSLKPFGEPAEDGVPEPLQFRLDERTSLMLVPTGGFGWVLGSRDVAPPGGQRGSAEPVRRLGRGGHRRCWPDA